MLKLSGDIGAVLTLISVGVFAILCLAVAAIVIVGYTTSSDVFSGVTAADLEAQNFVIVDDSPSASPGQSWGDLARENGIPVTAARLVVVDVTSRGPSTNLPLPSPGRYLAWALRVDPAGYGVPAARLVIAFNDANTGLYLGAYKQFPETVTPTPFRFVGTQPPTYP